MIIKHKSPEPVGMDLPRASQSPCAPKMIEKWNHTKKHIKKVESIKLQTTDTLTPSVLLAVPLTEVTFLLNLRTRYE